MNEKEREYIKKYMREYRAGRRRNPAKKRIREKIMQDRLNGDDIYAIGLRYNRHPCYVARLCQHLPIKKRNGGRPKGNTQTIDNRRKHVEGIIKILKQ